MLCTGNPECYWGSSCLRLPIFRIPIISHDKLFRELQRSENPIQFLFGFPLWAYTGVVLTTISAAGVIVFFTSVILSFHEPRAAVEPPEDGCETDNVTSAVRPASGARKTRGLQT